MLVPLLATLVLLVPLIPLLLAPLIPLLLVPLVAATVLVLSLEVAGWMLSVDDDTAIVKFGWPVLDWLELLD